MRVKGVGDGVLDALPLSYRGMGWVDGDGVGMSARGDGDDSEYRFHDLQSRRSHDVCQDRRLRLTSSWTARFCKRGEVKEYHPLVSIQRLPFKDNEITIGSRTEKVKCNRR